MAKNAENMVRIKSYFLCLFCISVVGDLMCCCRQEKSASDHSVMFHAAGSVSVLLAARPDLLLHVLHPAIGDPSAPSFYPLQSSGQPRIH